MQLVFFCTDMFSRKERQRSGCLSTGEGVEIKDIGDISWSHICTVISLSDDRPAKVYPLDPEMIGTHGVHTSKFLQQPCLNFFQTFWRGGRLYSTSIPSFHYVVLRMFGQGS